MKLKRTSEIVEAIALTNSAAFSEGEVVVAYKTEQGWLTTDSNGKKWFLFISHLRNENLFQEIKQYTKHDVALYLMEKNSDYQTVATDILMDAIDETLNANEYVSGIEDMYDYISTHLI